MSQHDNGRNHRNGGKAKAIPTSDREMGKPHNYATTVTNTPEPIIYGSCFLVLAFGLMFLIIGAVYVNKCELQPMLPIWLLVMGLILMITGVFLFITIRKTKNKPFRIISMVEKIVGIIILIVFVGWFIAGNVWVYASWGENPDYAHPWFSNGCNKSVFLLSFIAIITMDAFVGIFLIALCFWGVTQIVVRE